LYWLTLNYAAATVEQREERRKRRQNSPTTVQLLANVRQYVAELRTTIRETQQIVHTTEPVESNGISQSSIQTTKEVLQQLSVLGQEIASTLEVATQSAEQDREDFISEISMLRLLASAGTSLLLMQHQLRAFIDHISGLASDSRRLQSKMPESLSEDYNSIVTQLAQWHQLVDSQVGQLGALISPKSRENRKRLAVREVMTDVLKAFQYYISSYHINVSIEIPPAFRTPPMFYAELYAVLLNLTTNALKAVHNFPERHIKITAEKRDARLYIQMWNTGKKAPVEEWERYFKPFGNDKNNNPIFGVGTGLGLSIVKEILETYDGRARFVQVEEPWQTGLEISIPYR
jgi:signal transduction histidine kinase